MSNWKTTIGGVAGALPLIGIGITAILNKDYVKAAECFTGAVGLIFGGIHAQDSKI